MGLSRISPRIWRADRLPPCMESIRQIKRRLVRSQHIVAPLRKIIKGDVSHRSVFLYPLPMARKNPSKKKTAAKAKSAKEKVSVPIWVPLAILGLLLLLAAEVAILLPPAMAPEAVRPWIEQAQAIVPPPVPERADPEKAESEVRRLHERNMDRIAAEGQAEIDRIQAAIEEIRAENAALRKQNRASR